MIKASIYIMLLVCAIPVMGQQDKIYIQKGNALYKGKKYLEAEQQYGLAKSLNPERFESIFNEGTALYKQKVFDKAIPLFQQASTLTEDKNKKALALHNMGNSYLQSQKLDASIDAYKQALRLNSKDEETRYNLAYALQLKKQEEQKKQNKNQQEQQQEENKQQDPQQKQGDKKEEKQQQEKNDQNNSEKSNDPKKDGQGKPKKDEISKEDAEKMLKAIQNKENELQERKKIKLKGERVKIDKDW